MSLSVPKTFQSVTEGGCYGICDQGYKVITNTSCNYDGSKGLKCETKETLLSCNDLKSCPENYGDGYGQWEDWGPCSKTCVKGIHDKAIQSRQRLCRQKEVCSGMNIGT